MTNTVIGALRVNLGLDSAQFSAGLEKSEKRLDAFGKNTVRLSKTAVTSLDTVGIAVGTLGKTIIRGLAVGGVAGIVSSLRQVASSVAEIGTSAKQAGIDVRSFQELKYVAEQNRIGVDALTDGLKELSLRADEFIQTGAGSGAEAFNRLGYNAIDLKEKLKQPSELFTEIIGRLGQLDNAAQIRIADEIFGGTGGEKFVQLIAQGETGIRDTIKAANDLGLVMDQQLIERAAEVDRKFNAIATTVGTALKSAIVSAADSLMEFIDGFRSFENQQKSTLQNRQIDIAKERLALENQILEMQDKQSNGVDKLSDFALNLGFEGSKNSVLAGYTGQIDAAREKLQALSEEDAKITNTLSNRTQAMDRAATQSWVPPTPPPGGFGNTRTDRSGGSAAASSADRDRQAVASLIAELEREMQLVGASDEQKRASAALRQAGAAATEEERTKIVALNESLYQAEEANHAAAEAASFFKDAAYDAFTELIPKIETGNKALDRFVNTLIEAVAQSALLGEGPLAGGGGKGGGILGAFFSGLKVLFRADGGHIRGPGGPKSDKIPAMLSDGEFVVNASATRRFGPLLEAINAGALKLTGFNTGGFAIPTPIGNHDTTFRRSFR